MCRKQRRSSEQAAATAAEKKVKAVLFERGRRPNRKPATARNRTFNHVGTAEERDGA